MPLAPPSPAVANATPQRGLSVWSVVFAPRVTTVPSQVLSRGERRGQVIIPCLARVTYARPGGLRGTRAPSAWASVQRGYSKVRLHSAISKLPTPRTNSLFQMDRPPGGGGCALRMQCTHVRKSHKPTAHRTHQTRKRSKAHLQDRSGRRETSKGKGAKVQGGRTTTRRIGITHGQRYPFRFWSWSWV